MERKKENGRSALEMAHAIMDAMRANAKEKGLSPPTLSLVEEEGGLRILKDKGSSLVLYPANTSMYERWCSNGNGRTPSTTPALTNLEEPAILPEYHPPARIAIPDYDEMQPPLQKEAHDPGGATVVFEANRLATHQRTQNRPWSARKEAAKNKSNGRSTRGPGRHSNR